jgi:hypothetical protein
MNSTRRRDLSGIVTGHPQPDAPPVINRAWLALCLYLQAERPPGWVQHRDLVEAVADFIDASPALVADLVNAGVSAGTLTRRNSRIRLTATRPPRRNPR